MSITVIVPEEMGGGQGQRASKGRALQGLWLLLWVRQGTLGGPCAQEPQDQAGCAGLRTVAESQGHEAGEEAAAPGQTEVSGGLGWEGGSETMQEPRGYASLGVGWERAGVPLRAPLWAPLWKGGALRKSRWRRKKRERGLSLDPLGVRCLLAARSGGGGSGTGEASESTEEGATARAVWELPECRWC